VKTAGDLLQRHRSLRLLVMLLVIIAGVYAVDLLWAAFSLFADIILLFFLAWIITFILKPASLFLQSRGLPRALAVTLIYLALLIVIFSAVVLTIPVIAQQVVLVTNEMAQLLSPSNVTNLNATIIGVLERFGLSEQDARNVATQVSAQLPDWAAQIERQSVGAASILVTSVLSILFDVFLVIIISFYMMLDGDRLVESFVVRLPPAWIPDVRLFQTYVNRIFGGFFRAQLIIGALYGAITWLVLLALGEPNGLLVGILAGALMLLPFIGPFLAVVPPVLLVILQAPGNEVAVKLIILIFLLVAAQQLVIQVLAPRIFGDSMGIHPLLLFAALLVGAKVGGVWGAFFAGPIAAVAYAMVQVFYARFASISPLFQPRPLTDAEERAELEEGREQPVAEVIIPDPGASSHRHLRVPSHLGNGGNGGASRFGSHPRPPVVRSLDGQQESLKPESVNPGSLTPEALRSDPSLSESPALSGSRHAGPRAETGSRGQMGQAGQLGQPRTPEPASLASGHEADGREGTDDGGADVRRSTPRTAPHQQGDE
jgi:predicted PurR-regulated permease PerM